MCTDAFQKSFVPAKTWARDKVVSLRACFIFSNVTFADSFKSKLMHLPLQFDSLIAFLPLPLVFIMKLWTTHGKILITYPQAFHKFSLWKIPSVCSTLNKIFLHKFDDYICFCFISHRCVHTLNNYITMHLYKYNPYSKLYILCVWRRETIRETLWAFCCCCVSRPTQ